MCSKCKLVKRFPYNYPRPPHTPRHTHTHANRCTCLCQDWTCRQSTLLSIWLHFHVSFSMTPTRASLFRLKPLWVNHVRASYQLAVCVKTAVHASLFLFNITLPKKKTGCYSEQLFWRLICNLDCVWCPLQKQLELPLWLRPVHGQSFGKKSKGRMGRWRIFYMN